MPGPPPPRLTVLAARDADVAVVLARGPSDWAQLHLWDTATDVVTPGGWLHGRVSGRRVDLSPDGRLFVAFVAAHGRGNDPSRDTWVAISRPPWWQALALWFDGSTWSFGGTFPDATSCAGPGTTTPDLGAVPDWFDAGAGLQEPRPGPAWTDVTVPHARRVRDGWRQRDDGWWDRPLAGGGAAVVHERVSGAHVTTELALRWAEDLVVLPDDASLDVDRRGRALVGTSGRLEVHGVDSVDVVAELPPPSPAPSPAPDWAGRWPDPPP